MSFGLAAVAAVLVTVGFAALFASATSIKFLQPTATISERLLLATSPSPRPLRQRNVPAPPLPAPIPLVDQAWPPLQPPISQPESFTAQDYLKGRAQQNAAALRDKVTGGELRRSLGKATDIPALQDNQSFRTAVRARAGWSRVGCAAVGGPRY